MTFNNQENVNLNKSSDIDQSKQTENVVSNPPIPQEPVKVKDARGRKSYPRDAQGNIIRPEAGQKSQDPKQDNAQPFVPLEKGLFQAALIAALHLIIKLVKFLLSCEVEITDEEIKKYALDVDLQLVNYMNYYRKNISFFSRLLLSLSSIVFVIMTKVKKKKPLVVVTPITENKKVNE